MSFLILAMGWALVTTPQPAAETVFQTRPGCLPIPQQVSGDKSEMRRNRGTRLNEEPPAQLLLAVDRRINGCAEATVIRRDVSTPSR